MNIVFTEKEIEEMVHLLSGGTFGLNVLFCEAVEFAPDRVVMQKHYLAHLQKIKSVVALLSEKGTASNKH